MEKDKKLTTLNKLVIRFDNLPPDKIFTAQEITNILFECLEQENLQIKDAYNAGYSNGVIDTAMTNNEYFFKNYK